MSKHVNNSSPRPESHLHALTFQYLIHLPPIRALEVSPKSPWTHLALTTQNMW